MSLSVRDVLELVVRPALRALGPRYASADAERLVLGTAAKESGFAKLRQYGTGPALGLWQMEPFTFRDHWTPGGLIDRHDLRPHLLAMAATRAAVPFDGPESPDARELAWNLLLGAAMCRVHYLRDPHPLPAARDVAGQAAVWKRAYNTEKGAGKPEDYIREYQRLIAPLGLDLAL